MNTKPLLLIMFLLVFSIPCLAQDGINEPLATHLEEQSTLRWMWLKPDCSVAQQDLWALIRSSVAIDPTSEFVAEPTQGDGLGWSHTKFKHFVHGYLVEGSEYIFHVREEKVKKANGIIVTGDFPNSTATLTPAEACVAAHRAINASEYEWNETMLGDSENLPQWQLVLARRSQIAPWVGGSFRLAYKVAVNTLDPFGGHNVYVDAVTGETLKITPFVLECVAGTGNTLYNGSQAINAEERGFPYNDFYLKDDCREKHIQTYNRPGIISANVFDSDNNWASQNRAEVSIHWAAEMTYDYYLSEHQRKSTDNGGKRIKLVYRLDNKYDPMGASWDTDQDKGFFGSGDGTNAMVSLDIVGHEITHGVVHHAAELEYAGESGALNESFADIFGTCVEQYAVALFGPTNTADWTLGEDVAGGSIRSMEDPELFNQPEFFLGQNWFTVTSNCDQFNDNCGVHTNSGIQNLWFFLLAQGGTVTDAQLPNGSIRVCGIGIQEAARIAYRNLRFFLTKNAGFLDARAGAIQAAEDLFGAGTFQVNQCANAWHAVGVGGMATECPQVDRQEMQIPPPMAISIFPNPVSRFSRIMVESPRPASIMVEIFDPNGILVLKPQNTIRITQKGKHEFPFLLPGLASGVYLVKFQSGNETVLKKILVP